MSTTLQGASPYETWVLTLKAWVKDPRTSLDHLPPLADDTYSPDTHRRLLHHLTEAIRQVTERWQSTLTTALAGAQTPHELSRELVAARTGLARRLQICTHPSLPPGVRDILEGEVRDSIARYQRELEEAVRRQAEHASVDYAGTDAMLHTVRSNSLLHVLGYRLDTEERRYVAGVLPESGPIPATSPHARPRRRVMPHPSPER